MIRVHCQNVQACCLGGGGFKITAFTSFWKIWTQSITMGGVGKRANFAKGWLALGEAVTNKLPNLVCIMNNYFLFPYVFTFIYLYLAKVTNSNFVNKFPSSH